MTTEQRIERLDKRIDIFELYLNVQQSVLNYKYGKDRSLVNLFQTMSIIKSDTIQAQIIARQPMPKFAKGSYAKGGYAKGGFINNSGQEYVINDGVLMRMK